MGVRPSPGVVAAGQAAAGSLQRTAETPPRPGEVLGRFRDTGLDRGGARTCCKGLRGDPALQKQAPSSGEARWAVKEPRNGTVTPAVSRGQRAAEARELRAPEGPVAQEVGLAEQLPQAQIHATEDSQVPRVTARPARRWASPSPGWTHLPVPGHPPQASSYPVLPLSGTWGRIQTAATGRVERSPGTHAACWSLPPRPPWLDSQPVPADAGRTLGLQGQQCPGQPPDEPSSA